VVKTKERQHLFHIGNMLLQVADPVLVAYFLAALEAPVYEHQWSPAGHCKGLRLK